MMKFRLSEWPASSTARTSEILMVKSLDLFFLELSSKLKGKQAAAEMGRNQQSWDWAGQNWLVAGWDLIYLMTLLKINPILC